jgi:DNA-binding winged helix-turn-helix (wHTH) protein
MPHIFYSFGEFRLDPAGRELRQGDRLVELPRHVFDSLAYLVEHRDRAVGRDELVAAVWGRTEVSDTLIGQTVMRIRRELGDDGKEQRILRTIPRFGFRWIAETGNHERDVDASGATAEADDNRTDPLATPLSQPVDEPALHQPVESRSALITASKRSAGVVLVIILLATAVGLAMVLHDGRTPPRVATRVQAGQSVAVVVAELEQGTPAEWSWLRFGVMDVVANRLRSSGMPTTPSENVIALLGSAPGLTSERLRASGEFGVLVTPSVTHAGSRWQVRLNAEGDNGVKATVLAQAGDPTEAAKLAADRLLVALGREAPLVEGEARPNAELVERIDAAVLADDPALARSLVEQATPAQRNSPEVGLRLAKLDFRLGNSKGARERLLRLLDRASAQNDPVLRAGVLNGLGAVAIRDDQLDLAGQYFSEAVALLLELNDPAQLGEAYLGRAAAATEQHAYDNASADYARARVALRQANDTLALLRVTADEGFLDAELGRPSKALPQLIEASKGFQQWGAINEAIFVLIGEVDTHLDLLQAAQAVAAADAALQLSSRIDSRTTLDALALARSRALAAAGKLSQARAILDLLVLATPPPDPLTETIAALQRARIELDDGHPDQARQRAATSSEALKASGHARLRAEAEWITVNAALRAQDPKGAATSLAAFESWASSTRDRHVRLLVELARAAVDWSTGTVDAGPAFTHAREIAEETAVPAEIALVAATYADALLAEGDLTRAEVEIGRLSRWSDSDFGCAVLEARLYAALGRDEARQTALARARLLAGEREIPEDALRVPISTRAASAR